MWRRTNWYRLGGRSTIRRPSRRLAQFQQHADVSAQELRRHIERRLVAGDPRVCSQPRDLSPGDKLVQLDLDRRSQTDSTAWISSDRPGAVQGDRRRQRPPKLAGLAVGEFHAARAGAVEAGIELAVRLVRDAAAFATDGVKLGRCPDKHNNCGFVRAERYGDRRASLIRAILTRGERGAGVGVPDFRRAVWRAEKRPRPRIPRPSSSGSRSRLDAAVLETELRRGGSPADRLGLVERFLPAWLRASTTLPDRRPCGSLLAAGRVAGRVSRRSQRGPRWASPGSRRGPRRY